MTEITEPITGPAAPRGEMRIQEIAKLTGTSTRTGTTWNLSPCGSVMYMPRGCLAPSTTT